jgi:hypothetical protein
MDHMAYAHSGRDDLARALAEIADHQVRSPRPGERQEVVGHCRGRNPDQAVEQQVPEPFLRGQLAKLAPEGPHVALAKLGPAQSCGHRLEAGASHLSDGVGSREEDDIVPRPVHR